MSLKWTLLKSIQREPDNELHCFAMADLLEEGGWSGLLRTPWVRSDPGVRSWVSDTSVSIPVFTSDPWVRSWVPWNLQPGIRAPCA
jgi:hypothetical protein